MKQILSMLTLIFSLLLCFLFMACGDGEESLDACYDYCGMQKYCASNQEEAEAIHALCIELCDFYNAEENAGEIDERKTACAKHDECDPFFECIDKVNTEGEAGQE